MTFEATLISFAEDYHKMIVRLSSTTDQALFKGIVTISVDGVAKPLLILGNAHGRVEDGEIILVLNPRKSLIPDLKPGVTYGKGGIKQLVASKCDQMIHLWFDHYKAPPHRCSINAKYESKSTLPVEINADNY